MLSDLDAVRLCEAIYSRESSWDHLWPDTEPDHIYAALKGNALVFRGSVTCEDWCRDFRANPFQHPLLGGVEYGFAEGLDEFYSEVGESLPHDSLVVCGHSLGGARAFDFGALLTAHGRPPAAIIVFGSPRPGFNRLAEILQPITIHSYKNGPDPVTDVPLPFFPDFPYVQPRAFIELHVPPTAGDISPFCWHHIQKYRQGVEAKYMGAAA